jgi:hypothetical protein
MYLVIADTAAPSTNLMIGAVTSYSGTTLVVNSSYTIGSGTKTAWLISQSSPSPGDLQKGTETLLGTVSGVDTITAAASPTLATQAVTGSLWKLPAAGANTGATTLNIDSQGAVSVTRPDGTALQANDIPASGYPCIVEKLASSYVLLNPANLQAQEVAQLTALIPDIPNTLTTKIPTITATVAANAMTIGMSSCYLDFRSATLGSGTVSTVLVSPANTVISSGSTGGTVSAVQSDIYVICMNNGGVGELAWTNAAGGVGLNETGLISTTAEGGAGAADSATVVYSTTARTNLPYRVVGLVRSTQATAGTWATAPSLIQGSGGNALTAMSGLGYGQTWQTLTGSRVATTTYYNTTGKPIVVCINSGAAGAFSVNGIPIGVFTTSANETQTFIIPAGASYVCTPAFTAWYELR